MTARTTAAFLCLLCAISLSAIAAPGAHGETNGTTTFTCSPKALVLDFETEHCVPGQPGKKYGHIGWAGTTEIETHNKKTDAETTGAEPIHIATTIAGTPFEVSGTEVTGTGSIENSVSESGVHRIQLRERRRYRGLSVPKPAGKGCKVKGGEFETEELSGTSEGQGDAVKFAPTTGTLIGKFEVEGCSVPALNGVYELKGSVVGVPNGATFEFTHTATTGQGTLTLRGQKAGLDEKVTVTARLNSNEQFTPLACTTVPTP